MGQNANSDKNHRACQVTECSRTQVTSMMVTWLEMCLLLNKTLPDAAFWMEKEGSPFLAMCTLWFIVGLGLL